MSETVEGSAEIALLRQCLAEVCRMIPTVSYGGNYFLTLEKRLRLFEIAAKLDPKGSNQK